MTNIDALKALLAKVKAGGDLEDMYEVPAALGVEGQSDMFIAAYRGSMDAALALKDAVLPGWSWVKPDGPEMGTMRVFGPDNGDYYPSAVGKHEDPARALLIAILEALIAEAE